MPIGEGRCRVRHIEGQPHSRRFLLSLPSLESSLNQKFAFKSNPGATPAISLAGLTGTKQFLPSPRSKFLNRELKVMPHVVLRPVPQTLLHLHLRPYLHTIYADMECRDVVAGMECALIGPSSSEHRCAALSRRVQSHFSPTVTGTTAHTVSIRHRGREPARSLTSNIATSAVAAIPCTPR